MLKITDPAKVKILSLIEAEGREGLALRVAIRGRGPGGFHYEFGLVDEDDQATDDRVVDAGDFKVFVDKETVPNLKGSTLDFAEGIHGSGFKIDNPNPLWTDHKALKVQEIIDTKINPAVAAHGGQVTLLDVKDDVVYIKLGGGCQGCGMVDVTLKQGIEVTIKEALPEITHIIDSTDHAGGKNPYYQPSKGGPSALG